MAKRREKAKAAIPHSKVNTRGRFRVNIINPNGSKAGDSGWCDNMVTNLGFSQYICESVLGSGTAKAITHIALGTGTAPGAAATTLEGEVDHTGGRAAVSTSVVASKTAQVTGSFQSNAYITTTVTIQNIGLFNTSTRTTGTVLAGNTFATSTVASNQAVNMTYQLKFATAA